MKKIVRLARPFVLGHTVIIALMYCLIAGFDFETTLLATFAMLAMHSSAQITNLLKDVAIDKINKPWRPTVTGEVKRMRAVVFDIMCLILAFVAAYFVSYWFFSMMFVLWFFSWSFSLSPVRKNQFTHVLWMATTRGFLPAYMVTQNLCISILMFMWNFAFNPVKDYSDVEGDLRYGIKTIVNQYGEKGLRTWNYVFGAIFYILLTVLCLTGCLPYRAVISVFTVPIYVAIPNTLDERPAFSDNNMAYDLYWFGFTMNSVLIAISFLL